MNEEKIEFKLELNEEDKESSFILRMIFTFFIVCFLVFLIVDIDDQSVETQGIARQWGEAELINNESMKYTLLSESEKLKYVDIISETNKEQPTYSFKELDQFEYRISSKEYIYKLHYYKMDSCADCQKDIWVPIKKDNTGWFVSHINYSESEAEPKIRNVEREQIPTTEKQEKELEEKKSIIMKFLK